MFQFPLFPRPVSWLSAALLYVFLGLWMTFLAATVPPLYEMLQTSPRLAALGFLGVWTSPIFFVGAFHHVVHLFLRRAEGASASRGVLPGVGSLWSGVFAWFVVMFATSVGLLIMIMLFPPSRDRTMTSMLMQFAWPFEGEARAGVHTIAWVVVAAQLYDLERAMKERAKRGEA